MQTDVGGDSDQDVSERRNIVPPGFETVARHDGESLEVALVGELDMAATFKLEAEVERLLARDGLRRLVLDLADLSFVDSAGLGALLAIRDRAQGLGIEMILMNPSDPVRRILDLSGMGAVLLE
jgi:anti-sigma B factor antagonist